MRPLLLTLLVLLISACDIRTRDERDLERAERELEHARQELAEARERLDEDVDEARDRVREAREKLRDLSGESRSDLREEVDRIREDLDEAFEDVDIEATVAEAMDDLERALDVDEDVEAVDFRKLRDLLPEELDGMNRENVKGENAGALGIRISHAEARYDGVGRDVKLSLVDLGSLHKATRKGLDWLDAHVDREWEDGYERTTEIDGHPAHVKVQHRGSRTDLEATLLVEDRFVVHIEADGREIDDDLIREILEHLRRLRDLL